MSFSISDTFSRSRSVSLQPSAISDESRRIQKWASLKALNVVSVEAFGLHKFRMVIKVLQTFIDL